MRLDGDIGAAAAAEPATAEPATSPAAPATPEAAAGPPAVDLLVWGARELISAILLIGETSPLCSLSSIGNVISGISQFVSTISPGSIPSSSADAGALPVPSAPAAGMLEESVVMPPGASESATPFIPLRPFAPAEPPTLPRNPWFPCCSALPAAASLSACQALSASSVGLAIGNSRFISDC